MTVTQARGTPSSRASHLTSSSLAAPSRAADPMRTLGTPSNRPAGPGLRDPGCTWTVTTIPDRVRESHVGWDTGSYSMTFLAPESFSFIDSGR